MATKAKEQVVEQVQEQKRGRGRPAEHPYEDYAEHVIEVLKFQDAGVGLSKSDIVDSFDPPLENGVWNSLARRMMQAKQIRREGAKRGTLYYLEEPPKKAKRARSNKSKAKAKTA